MHQIEQAKQEKAILVGIVRRNQSHEQVEEYLAELALLADTAAVDTLAREIQVRNDIDPAYFIGSGKADELADLVKELKANVIIFDEDLSPAQARNLENRCNVKVIDRSGLILDIFARRAKSREAKTQVELAQLEYLLPRLTRRWTHLSRQTSGAGVGLRGPGEKQLEVDRRMVTRRIAWLKNELEKIGKQRDIRRKHRKNVYKVAIIGYTNVGKSTLLNALTESDVFVEDRLFATLDATVRKMEATDGQKILLIDTVGFIRKLPHQLIASFKSTLDETQDADLLLHVIDISSASFRDQISAVQNVMAELKLSDKPLLHVFNKVDQLNDKNIIHQVKEDFSPCVIISAKKGIFLEELKRQIFHFTNENFIELNVELKIDRQKDVSQIYSIAEVLSKEYENSYVKLTVRVDKAKLARLKQLIE